MKLILVRHGETVANQEGLLDGQHDTELSENGKKQISVLADYLKEIRIDKIFCSPLSRSKETAQAIAKGRDVKIVQRSELLEIDCGICTMMKRTKVIEDYPELYKGWQDLIDPPFPEGECLRDVENRIEPFLNEIIDGDSDQTILIAGHGSLNVCILGKYLEIKHGLRFKIRQDNSAINILSFKGNEFSIDGINILASDLFFQKYNC